MIDPIASLALAEVAVDIFLALIASRDLFEIGCFANRIDYRSSIDARCGKHFREGP